jgi:hypothetical protein
VPGIEPQAGQTLRREVGVCGATMMGLGSILGTGIFVSIGITAAPLRGVLTRGLGVRSLSQWFGKARFSFVWGQGGNTLPVQRELAELIRDCATGMQQRRA